jgi:hypothetical protein
LHSYLLSPLWRWLDPTFSLKLASWFWNRRVLKYVSVVLLWSPLGKRCYPYDLIYLYNLFLDHMLSWYVSYQSLSRSWHTDLDYSSYHLFNVEIRLTAGVTGQQGTPTPPWHLIPPLIYSEVRVHPFSDLYFL